MTCREIGGYVDALIVGGRDLDTLFTNLKEDSKAVGGRLEFIRIMEDGSEKTYHGGFFRHVSRVVVGSGFHVKPSVWESNSCLNTSPRF